MSFCRVHFHPAKISLTISLYLLMLLAHRCISGHAYSNSSAWIHGSSEVPKLGLSVPRALFLGGHSQETLQFLHGLHLLLLHSRGYGQSTWQAGTNPWCLSQGRCKKITKPSLHGGKKEAWGFADEIMRVEIINFWTKSQPKDSCTDKKQLTFPSISYCGFAFICFSEKMEGDKIPSLGPQTSSSC